MPKIRHTVNSQTVVAEVDESSDGLESSWWYRVIKSDVPVEKDQDGGFPTKTAAVTAMLIAAGFWWLS